MIACPNCQGQSPDESRHCVHCGHRFGEPDATQLGMPSLRPQGPAPASEKSGAQTTQFGPGDLARLAAAAEDGETESGAGDKRSLLAGMPRPPVSSARSPLTDGLSAPVRPSAPATPSARRTVMGMPIFGTPAPAPRNTQSESPKPALGPAEGRAKILSLDSFEPGAPTPVEPNPPAAMRAASDASRASDLEAGMEPTVALEPVPGGAAQSASVEVAGEPASVEPLHSAPTRPPAPRDPERSAAATTGEALRKRVSTAERETPGGERFDLVRGVALMIGVVLIGLFVWPLHKAWFWEIFEVLDGRSLYTFLGTALAGVVSLFAGIMPMRAGARGALVVLAGLAGAACLVLS